MKLQQACFLAALPCRRNHRRKGGGWPLQNEEKLWKDFLQEHYTPNELEKARNEARLCREILVRQKFAGDIKILHLWGNDYPPLLRGISDPPPVLFVFGDPITPGPFVTMAGTHQPLPITRAAIRHYIGARPSGVAIVSGLARGVEREAIFAALQNRIPAVAVCDSGIFPLGPDSLDLFQLARKTRTPFTIISEFLLEPPSSPRRFPRNRIHAGLSSQTIVMQAPERSEALVTARCAIEEGRVVSVFDHFLFRKGYNEGGKQFLEAGAVLLKLPELERCILRRPPRRKKVDEKTRKFRELENQGKLSWLGAEYYLYEHMSGNLPDVRYGTGQDPTLGRKKAASVNIFANLHCPGKILHKNWRNQIHKIKGEKQMIQPKKIASQEIQVTCYDEATQKKIKKNVEISYYDDHVVRVNIPEGSFADVETVKNYNAIVKKISRAPRPFLIVNYRGKPKDVKPESVRYVGSEEHLSQFSGIAVVNPFQNSVLSTAINYFNAFSDFFSDRTETRFFSNVEDSERWIVKLKKNGTR